MKNNILGDNLAADKTANDTSLKISKDVTGGADGGDHAEQKEMRIM